MCRNIKTLYNIEPTANEDEVRAAATQFVRKISGFRKPSTTNQETFDNAVKEITRAATAMLSLLTTTAPPRNRDLEAAKARARAVRRFGGGTK